uniref:thiol:disulfide interchange protein n=1 Tax=Aphanocladia delicatula TaxID=3041656 RepID=UPI002551D49B|nr:thiol:disulfide interchange protein [Aphanocladia delicatula]WGH14150.1 thiol:disulfide interchange protein [Aphanocladia delicatula]
MLIFLHDFVDKYYSLLYRLQIYLSYLLFKFNDEQNVFFLMLIFLLGLLTVFTPCFISILPLALSYLNANKYYRLNMSLFIAGLLTSFMGLILLSNLVGSSFFIYKLPILSDLILVLVALDLMKILNFSKFIKFLNFNSSIDFNYHPTVQSYLTGVVIGSTSLPCNTSVLIIVTYLLHSVHSFFLVFLYLFFYLIGCVLPLLLILNVRFNYQNFSISFFIWKLIFPLSGSFLFIFSCFSLLKSIFT